MKPRITAENYEEIMFRLLEGDFDELTSSDLLAQIEADPLFRFEWDSWKKTIFTDPIENYTSEGSVLAESIITRTEPRIYKKRIFYYLAAASVAVLMVSWFLLNVEFNVRPDAKVAEKATKPRALPEIINQPAQQVKAQSNTTRTDQNEVQLSQNETFSITINTADIQTEEVFTEIPILIDSVSVEAITLHETTVKKSRYSVTVETTALVDNNLHDDDLTQNRKVKYDKVLTNSRLYVLRKPNGEPDRLVVMGEDNNYLCLRFNYVEK